MKKFIKISPIFILLFLCSCVLLFFCFGLIEPILAIELGVSIPGRGKYVTDVADYIIAIYKFGAGVAGMVAVVVIMWGGILWLTAGGKSEAIQSAKSYISSALLGLVLVFGSYMLMHSIKIGRAHV